MRIIPCVFTMVLLLILTATSVPAHGTYARTWVEDLAVRVEACYADGDPMGDLPYEVRDASGTIVASGRTDEQGCLSLRPDLASPPVVTVTDPHGHQLKLTLSTTKVIRALERGRFSPDKDASVEDSTAPKVSIGFSGVGSERSPGLAVLSGLGYIVGLTGLVAWWVTRRARKTDKDSGA